MTELNGNTVCNHDNDNLHSRQRKQQSRLKTALQEMFHKQQYYRCNTTKNSSINDESSHTVTIHTTEETSMSSTSSSSISSERLQLVQQSLGDFGVALFCPLLDLPAEVIGEDNKNKNTAYTDAAATVQLQQSPSSKVISCPGSSYENLTLLTEEESDDSSTTSTSSSPLSDNDNYNNDDDNNHIDYYPVNIRPDSMEDLTDCPRILTSEMMQELTDYGMPTSVQQHVWERCFCIGLHGDSFVTLLNQCKPYKYTLLVIRTMQGDILGGFASEPWQQAANDNGGPARRNSSSGYYGNGLSFLFVSNHNKNNKNNITNNDTIQLDTIDEHHHDASTQASFTQETESTKPSLNSSSKHQQRQLTLYKWTGKNDYCQICDVTNRVLCMGGVGDFGLVIRNNLSMGVTGRSETYGNPPLIDNTINSTSSNGSMISSDGSFEIADFEIYGLSSLLHTTFSSSNSLSSFASTPPIRPVSY